MDFTLPNYIYKVTEIVKVVDGDTVYIIIDLGMHITVYKKIRMLDIDTDEVRGGTIDTKLRANLAKDRLKTLLESGDVYIQTKMDTTGKYGRLLGDFYVVDGDTVIDVKATLIDEGYEKGGTGTTFIEKIKSFLLRKRV